MSQVGAFPTHDIFKRRTIRGPVNPLDRATVVSILPKPINERKVTIFPGIFNFAPGSFENPSILILGPSSWWRDIDEDQPLLEIPVSSITVAESVVVDYCNSILASDMADCMPGLFYIPGCKYLKDGKTPSTTETLAWIKSEFKGELEAARVRQHNWFSMLVRMGDSLWARSNGNPLVISDDMRLAAKELNLTNQKDWMKDHQMVDMVRCKACGSLKNPLYPICAQCHYPDPDHPMTKELMAAKSQMPKQG